MRDPLVGALLAIDPIRLERLYHNSPEFHASIDMLARIARPVVGLIADDAVAQQMRKDAAAIGLIDPRTWQTKKDEDDARDQAD